MNILITGIGAPGGPSIIKHIKKNVMNCKIIGVDSHIKYCASNAYVDFVEQIPMATDENFLNSIILITEKYNINYIISLVTNELLILSKNKNLFEQKNVKFFTSSEDTINLVTNKYKLYQELEHLIPIPKYKLINIKEILNFLNEFNYPEKNVCFKPLNFDGARGFRIISNKIDRLKSIMTEKPYNYYISKEELEILINLSTFDCQVLLSEYLPGTEYTVDLFVKNNNIDSLTIRERIKLKDHISFVGKIVKNDLIENYVFKIAQQISFNGSVGFQFKNNDENIPNLLECNPRLQGATILSCQQNYDYILANLDIYNKICTSPKSVVMSRYFNETYFIENI